MPIDGQERGEGEKNMFLEITLYGTSVQLFDIIKREG